MSNTSSNTGWGGVGLAGILFLIFLVLKLTGNIAWSWWWITAPLWIPFGIFVVLTGVLAIIAAVIGKKASKAHRDTSERRARPTPPTRPSPTMMSGRLSHPAYHSGGPAPRSSTPPSYSAPRRQSSSSVGYDGSTALSMATTSATYTDSSSGSSSCDVGSMSVDCSTS